MVCVYFIFNTIMFVLHAHQFTCFLQLCGSCSWPVGLNIPTFIQPDIYLLDNFHSCFLVLYSFSVIDYYYNCHLIGWPVTEVELKEAALHSGVLQVEEDFLEATFRTKCEEIWKSFLILTKYNRMNARKHFYILKCYWNEIFVSFFLRPIYSFKQAYNHGEI